ncbi:DUF4198 domain-containing protein [bacterium]|nr:DUF4198 domain-containing protein [bacterium]
MRTIKTYSVKGLLVAFSLFFSTVVSSHTLWLNATDYYPEIYSPKYGAKTIIYFGWGHGYPVADFLSADKLSEFKLITPKGENKPLQPGQGGFLATRLNLFEKGTYIVAASLKPGFYTMYAEKGQIHHKGAPKTGLSGVIVSLHFEQYAKALINVAGSDSSFRKPVGHTLEIIPLVNPAELKVGDYLPVQVLFKGRPARFCPVYGTYAGFSTGDDFAFAATTDGRGKAKIRILHHGPWLIKTKVKLPAPDELKDKCDELSYTATLTFEIK